MGDGGSGVECAHWATSQLIGRELDRVATAERWPKHLGSQAKYPVALRHVMLYQVAVLPCQVTNQVTRAQLEPGSKQASRLSQSESRLMWWHSGTDIG